ncbi:type II toxin-antitoxin system VapB family antitoxin [Aureimonas sp. AU12]|jgi:antitoxin VapB|uniref:type II toxin-antitoxin system VapB family antitoxin n=1 Tax=Aureimonas sp. AU12 TaxID=1638161 RepID=UPI000706CDE8|nr:type II toxin-antitoxin system VapB family antitoxin [Aureimonas sp. AU12]BAT29787.1 hypothetical protein [Aureimonas sp. AU12]
MSLLIEDAETVATIRRLADRDGRTPEDVVRQAVKAAAVVAADHAPIPLRQRFQAIGDEWAKVEKTGEKADKAFFDSLGGDL